MNIRRWMLALALAFSGVAQSQTLTGLTVTPVHAAPGQAVKATTTLEVTNGQINCHVRMNWGDGQTQEFRINQDKDVPLVLEHRYAKAGTYQLKMEGKGAFKCLGPDQTARVDVGGKAGAVHGRGGAATTAACPRGWALTKAGVHKKTGAYTCVTKPGTPLPEPRPACPGDLTYFDNVKKGQMGCRP